MNISENIPLDVNRVLTEISWRLMSTWNGDMTVNSKRKYPMLDKLFEIINSGVPEEDFFYKGDLFRIHHAQGIDKDKYNPFAHEVLGRFSGDDGQLCVVSRTRFDGKLSSFSKSYDFTNPVWCRVVQSCPSRFIYANTGSVYGIDVNAFLKRFNIFNRWADEQEVLFPIWRENVIVEYNCTPPQMKEMFDTRVEFVPAVV